MSSSELAFYRSISQLQNILKYTYFALTALFSFCPLQRFSDRHHIRKPPEGGFKWEYFNLQSRLQLPQRVRSNTKNVEMHL